MGGNQIIQKDRRKKGGTQALMPAGTMVARNEG